MVSWGKTIGLVLLAVVCLGVAARFSAHASFSAQSGSAAVLGADAPPGVRFITVALGGFRGLLADVLWVRASDLQDEGHFFEVAQLADWITRLEPRYPEVWSYHAWNMAYNITAVVPDPADRWHWVQNGVKLLRDQGIPSNPDEPKLYWELGWMFYDKVGGRYDEATRYYRIQWAREMSAVVGQGMLNYEALNRRPEALLAFRRAGLDPAVMKTVDRLYGPLDWRLPESQVLYWGVAGKPYQKRGVPWCDRLIWMGMTEQVKQGYLAFNPDRKIYQQAPRIDLAMQGIRRCRDDGVFTDSLVGLAAARFLRESVVILYAFGKRVEADEALGLWRQHAETGGRGATLDEFVAREAAEMESLSPDSRLDRITHCLMSADVWKRLDVPDLEEGYTKLARIYWDALAKIDPRTRAWETLRQQAQARVMRETPVP